MKDQEKKAGEKKKILFVTNTMGRAGAEKCLQALLELLDPEKYDLSVYSIINRGELYSDMPEYVHILNKNPCTKSVLDSAGLAAIGRQILWSLVKKFSFITYIPYFFRVLMHQIKIKRLDFSKLFWMLLARNAKRFDEEYDLAVAFIEGAATYYVADYVKAKKKATYVHIDYLAAGYSPKLDKKYYDNIPNIRRKRSSSTTWFRGSGLSGFPRKAKALPTVLTDSEYSPSADFTIRRHTILPFPRSPS